MYFLYNDNFCNTKWKLKILAIVPIFCYVFYSTPTLPRPRKNRHYQGNTGTLRMPPSIFGLLLIYLPLGRSIRYWQNLVNCANDIMYTNCANNVELHYLRFVAKSAFWILHV